MKKFGITFWFYAKDHFKTKSLIWLAVTVAATVGIAWALMTFGGGSNAQVAIVQESDVFVVDNDILLGLSNIDFHFVETEVQARQLFEDGDVDDIFMIQGVERPELSIVSSNLNPNDMVHATLIQVLTTKNLEITALYYNLPMEVVLQLIMPIETHVEVTDFDELIAAEIISFILPYAVFMLVLMSGTMVANSVASEKSSRVMEVMLGKVHPTISMISKVLSSFLGVIMPLVGILIGLIIAHIVDIIDISFVVDLINDFISIEALGLTIIVLLLGYFCFVFLFAAAGAIANSVESLATTISPLTYMIGIPFLAATFMDIGGAIMDILVYVPLISPYVLVQRFMLGYSGWVEVGISLALMVAFGVLTLIVSARLYMNGISHNSEKVSLKDLRKMLQK